MRYERATNAVSKPFFNLIILQWTLGVATLPTTVNTISLNIRRRCVHQFIWDHPFIV